MGDQSLIGGCGPVKALGLAASTTLQSVNSGNAAGTKQLPGY